MDAIQAVETLITLGQYKVALGELDKLQAANPNSSTLFSLRALCFLETRTHNAALSCAAQAVACDANDDYAYYIYARCMFGAWCFPNKSFQIGPAPQDAKKWREKMEELLLRAIELNPYRAPYFAFLGDIKNTTGNFKPAEKAAEKGLEIDPTNADCLNVLTISLLNQNRLKEAVVTSDRALRSSVEDSFTHTNVGWVMLHAGQYERARRHFEEGLRLHPFSQWAKEGYLEGIRAKYFVYRPSLRYALWSDRRRNARFYLLLILAMEVCIVGPLAYFKSDLACPMAGIIPIAVIMLRLFGSCLSWFARYTTDFIILLIDPSGKRLMDYAKRVRVTIFALLSLWTASWLAIAFIFRITADLSTPYMMGSLIFLVVPLGFAANVRCLEQKRSYGIAFSFLPSMWLGYLLCKAMNINFSREVSLTLFLAFLLVSIATVCFFMMAVEFGNFARTVVNLPVEILKYFFSKKSRQLMSYGARVRLTGCGLLLLWVAILLICDKRIPESWDYLLGGSLFFLVAPLSFALNVSCLAKTFTYGIVFYLPVFLWLTYSACEICGLDPHRTFLSCILCVLILTMIIVFVAMWLSYKATKRTTEN